jgi:lycopene beta-cyclase
VTTVEYDAVIAGGGLSGLSLAAHLAAGGWRQRRVLIVDDRSAHQPAVCWASWSTGSGLLDGAVSHAYHQVQVHAAGTSRMLPLGRYRYRMVRRADLRRAVTDLLAGCPGFEVRDGRVESVRDGAEVGEVVVDGTAVRAGWVFDSITRPPPGTAADARLAFTGWEIQSTRPVFEPQIPVLFDFRIRHAGGARFGYVLPDGSHRALVELTEFVPRHADPPTAAERGHALGAYLRDVLDCPGYRVIRTESAVLPLRVRPPSRRRGRGRVLAIGARAGLVKASTGYAYQRIQRDSEAIARSLARYGHPFDLPVTRRRHRLLDAVLLELLDRDPPQLELAFATLFSANPAERVLRFLDEDTTVRDELRLIATLPPGPYIRAAVARAARACRPI